MKLRAKVTVIITLIFISVFQAALLLLKLFNIIDWKWVYTLMPLIIVGGSLVLMTIIGLFCALRIGDR